MFKYWRNNQSGDDKFIILKENRIYKANPVKSKTDEFELLINTNQIPKVTFFIPNSEIRYIEMEQNKNYFVVHHGIDSSEEFHISDNKKRQDIFETFKAIEGAAYSESELSLYEKTKTLIKPMIGFTILFLLGFLFSLRIESNTLPNGSYPAIIVFIGSLGSINSMILYTIIITILGYKFKKSHFEKIMVYRIKFRELN